MMTEGANSPVLTISAFWSSSRWPRATWMSSKRQISIPLGGRYKQVSLYQAPKMDVHLEVWVDMYGYMQQIIECNWVGTSDLVREEKHWGQKAFTYSFSQYLLG